MDQQQRRPDSQTLNVGVLAPTASGNRLIADVDNWQYLRQESCSPTNTEVIFYLNTHARMNHAFAFPAETGPRFTEPRGMED